MGMSGAKKIMSKVPVNLPSKQFYKNDSLEEPLEFDEFEF